MAISELFTVNQRFTLEFKYGGGMVSFPSRVEEVGPDRLVIAAPLDKGVPLSVADGRHLVIKAVVGKVPFRFSSSLLAQRSGAVPLWEIALPRGAEKLQQRNYVRLDVMVPVTVYIAGERERERPLRAVTKDLSGGGTLVVLRERLAAGMKCFLTLEIPDSEPIRTAGEIVRIDQPQADSNVFWTAIKFIGLPENERDVIIRFIFKKQLELKRKGLWR